MHFLLFITWLSATGYSIPWDGPYATPIASVANSHSKSIPQSPPESTSANWSPNPSNDTNLELLKRSNGAPNLCGYINAVSSISLTCPSASACAFNTAISGVGCCASSTIQNTTTLYAGCEFYTTCYDYSMISSCDGSCRQNALIRKCSAVDNPSCYKWDFQDIGHRYWGCTSTHFNISVNIAVTTTQDAQFASKGSLLVGAQIDPLLYATVTHDTKTMSLESEVVNSAGVCASGCWGWECASATPCQSSLTCYAGYCRDASAIPSTSITKSSSLPAAVTTRPSNSPSTVPSLSPVPTTDSVSPAVVVGTTVGGLLGLFATIFLILFLLERQRRSNLREAEASADTEDEAWSCDYHEISRTMVSKEWRMVELDGGSSQTLEEVMVHALASDVAEKGVDCGFGEEEHQYTHQ